MGIPSSMAFRQMLVKLSNIITARELGSLKYQCTDLIPRATMEDITESHQLWSALEDMDKLSVDNIEFLQTLLSVACEGNQKIVEILEAYKRTAEHTGQIQDLQKEFDVIRLNIGRDWRPLARKLLLSEVDIETISDKYDKDIREQVTRCLITWQRRHKDTATRQTLVAALKACNKNMIAHQVDSLQ